MSYVHCRCAVAMRRRIHVSYEEEDTCVLCEDEKSLPKPTLPFLCVPPPPPPFCHGPVRTLQKTQGCVGGPRAGPCRGKNKYLCTYM